ncbi:pantoate--beta-alanine ligase [Methylomonas paludis]|uniref:Pantothenate synthetase n=1 Tax=Methylomonas paludis TaxID=1173101 RepID=A0A975MNW0_9GAMM|nr:pantoate--beta-alanine ligase [Methylomonas paludis]QWF70779.1 pantoate--beta-alanine ligase [Methylomonas paludis]
MQTISTIKALRACIRQWRQAGHSIAFVPTMGNLHAGHIQLVTTAKQKADKVVVSIFVNPTQFGPTEDFNCYPRTEQQDQAALLENGADLLFLPAETEMYPQPAQTRISVQNLSDMHCGASRPGHFDGVALVVCKLLNMVQPDLLLLGEKDFQQLTIIRRMIADLNIPVEIQGVATVREADGLAMSSRNGYLDQAQRQLAPKLYQALLAARSEILAGNLDFQTIVAIQWQILQQTGFKVEYFNVCRSSDLLAAGAEDNNLVILLAAKLGNTRLIDNICFSRPLA